MRKIIKEFPTKATEWIGSIQSLIVHTIFFIVIFGLRFFGVSAGDILLILTTIVSLEAIYLAIFIQMTINRHSDELEEVSEDIEEIQKDVDEIQRDVDEIQEDVEDISEDDEQFEIEEAKEREKIEKIEATLQSLMEKLEELKK